MKPEISIIVPVYNVEQYLCRCLDSILSQTFANFELILVDDGSTDSSGTICDVYVKKDSRIKVLHKKNGGLSDARNYGIDFSNGNYIGFVDSDDWISTNMYEILYKNIKDENADISICQLHIKHDLDMQIINRKETKYTFTTEEAIKKLFENKLFGSHAVNKLYKKELFINIKYPVGKIYEDLCTTYKLLDYSKKIVYSNHIGYFYFQRKNSILNTKFDHRLFDYSSAYEEIIQFCKKKYPSVVKLAEIRHIEANLLILNKMIEDNIDDNKINKVLDNIKKSKLKYFQTSTVPWKSKLLMALFLFFGYNKYAQIYRLIGRIKRKKG